MRRAAACLSIFVVSLLVASSFCPAAETGAHGGGLAVGFAADVSAPRTNVRLLLKNATALYTKYLGVDLVGAARKTLAAGGYAVGDEMNIDAFRFESFIHYNPRDRAAAEAVRSALKVGTLVEDKTLDFGLVKVVLGADAISVLLPGAVFPPGTIILDATGVEGKAASLRETTSSDVPVVAVFTVNKGMMEKTTILYPTEGLGAAGKIKKALGMGVMKEVGGLPNTFVVVGPDFAGEQWKNIPDWTPEPTERYYIVIYKTKAILAVKDSRGRTAVRYPISIGANPDLADKKAVGDRRTPEGDYTISAISESSGWRFEGELAYGPWFFALNTPPWTGYAIHGTNEPYLIGAPASHGCIRLNVENLYQLKKAVRVGTPVKIVH